jgi:hypothetical protein
MLQVYYACQEMKMYFLKNKIEMEHSQELLFNDVVVEIAKNKLKKKIKNENLFLLQAK